MEAVKSEVDAAQKGEVEMLNKAPVTISEKIEKVEELIRFGPKETKGKKKFELPYKIRMRQKRLARLNKLIIFMAEKNMRFDAVIGEIRNGRVWYDGLYYACPANGLFLWRGKIPAMILPKWSMKPMTLGDFKDEQIAQRIIIQSVEAGEAGDSRKKLGGKSLIFIILGVIAGAYLLFGGGVGG